MVDFTHSDSALCSWGRSRLVAVTCRHGTEAQCFGDMRGASDIVLIEVGDGSCHTQHPVKRARREAQSLGGRREQLPRVRLDRCRRLQPASGRAAVRRRPTERRVARALTLAGAFDTRSRVRRSLTLLAHGELANGYCFHRYVEIDPIDEWPRQACAVAKNVRRGARAALRRVAGAPARTGIHCADEREARRIADAPRRSGDDDVPILERLTHRIERVSWKLEHLVEKQHAQVRETDLTGTWRRAATDQSGRRDRVVRRAKWPRRRRCALRRQEAGDGMHGDDLERLALVQRRQEAGHAAREHRLPRPRRPDENHPVITRGGDLQSALGGILADDLAKIRCISRDAVVVRRRRRRNEPALAELPHELTQRARRCEPSVADELRLADVPGRNDERRTLVARDESGNGKYAAYGTNRAVERELADRRDIDQTLGRDLSSGHEHA